MPIIRMPDGKLVRFDDNMPKEQIQSMIASKYPEFAASKGYQETPQNYNAEKNMQQPQEKSYNAGRLGTIDRGLTFGLGRKAGGLINAIGAYPVDRAAQALGVENTPSFWDRYHEIVDPAMQAIEEYHQDKPKEAFGLEFGASLVNPANRFGVGYIGKGANLANKAARSAGVGGVVGGVAGGLNTENTEELPVNIAGGTIIGGALGGTLPYAASKAGDTYRAIRNIVSPRAAVADMATGLGNVAKDNQSMRMLSRGIQASDDVAAQVATEAPTELGRLNDEMANILNDTTGRKIDIKQTMANKKQQYNDFIKANADKKVLNFEEENATIGMKGQENGQLSTAGAETAATGTAANTATAAGQDEKSAALRDLVKFGQDHAGVARDGLFIRRYPGSSVFSVNPEVEHLFDKANFSKVDIHRLKNTPDDALKFHNAIKAAKQELGPVGEQVWVYSPEEYQNMKLFLTDDGLSGIAVKPDGDIVSVFSSPSAKFKDAGSRGHSLVELAKQEGGTKLDAFDTFLPTLYSKHGFKETGRFAWDPEIAKNDLPNWNKEFFKKWNNGEPDVVFMNYEAPLPTVSSLFDGLNPYQTEQLQRAIEQGLKKTNQPAGSLESVNKIKQELNKIINDSQQPNPMNRTISVDTPDTVSLREIKPRLNAILGRETKTVDKSYAKAKDLEKYFNIGYNFRPSETKFESLSLKSPLMRRAFLQGRISKILDNVKNDKNLSKAIRDDENTLKKLMPQSQFNRLISESSRIDTEYGRIQKLASNAKRKLEQDAEVKKTPKLDIGTILRSMYDTAHGNIFKNSNRQIAEYLLNGGATKPSVLRNLERIVGRQNPDYLTPYLAQYLSENQ